MMRLLFYATSFIAFSHLKDAVFLYEGWKNSLVLNDFVTALESSSATLTVALYVYASERGETGVAFAIAVILMTLTLLLNFAANMAAKKLKNV